MPLSRLYNVSLDVMNVKDVMGATAKALKCHDIIAGKLPIHLQWFSHWLKLDFDLVSLGLKAGSMDTFNTS